MSETVMTMDENGPVCVADDVLEVGLVNADYQSDEGIVHAIGARVTALAVDEGSYDNCFEVGRAIRWVTEEGEVIKDYASYIDFTYSAEDEFGPDCERVEWVDLKVWEDINANGIHDEGERYSVCPSKLHLRDQSTPEAEGDACFVYDCLDHDFEVPAPEITWDPAGCAEINLISDDTTQHHCPVYRACDGDQILVKSERILVYRLTKDTKHGTYTKDITYTIYEELVEDVTITMPFDQKIACGEALNIDAPVIDNQGCEEWFLSEVEISDFTTAGEGLNKCGLILYEYEVINWCRLQRWEKENGTINRESYDQLVSKSTGDIDNDDKLLDNGVDEQIVLDENSEDLLDGYARYQISVIIHDDEDPVAVIADTAYCEIGDGCFNGAVEFDITIMDNCINPPTITEWFINEDDGDNYGFEINDNTIAGSSLAKGVYELHVRVDDACGNFAWYTSSSEVLWDDCKKPTISCGASFTAVMENGMVMIPATSIVQSLSDNCASENDLYQRLTIAVATDTNEDGVINQDDITSDEPLGEATVTLSCQQYGYGYIPVTVWTVDNEMNVQYCLTAIHLQPGTEDPCSNGAAEAAVIGDIVTEFDETIDDVTINVWNSSIGSFSELFNGFFNISVPMNSDAMVDPEKDINHLNGISTGDMVLLQKHILGIETLKSPYKLIAADVRRDEKINTRDMLHLRRLILGIYDEFPNSDSWRFIPKNYEFVNPTSPWGYPEQIEFDRLEESERADFIGIKIGDISGNARPNRLIGETDSPLDYLEVHTSEQLIQAHVPTPIVLTASSENQISGYQFTMSVSPGVSIMNIQPGTLPAMSDANFGLNRLNDGVITTSWSVENGTSITEDDQLFVIEIITDQTMFLSDILSINSSITKAEAYDAEVNEMGVQLLISKEGNQEFKLYQNVPNPFDQQTSIGFDLPKDDAIEMIIRDISGRVIKTISGNYPKGYNEISLPKEELNVQGVLYYELKTSTTSATKKMVIVR